ncbi:OmpA family protein [Psychrobacter frigidicola]|uniref:OmpA family protein n=1 Tax=Psychrobacter frigidicola TaxID=45611 RepID=A0A5C7A466_9GAMM|nr:OmpA family protein [Psychrobacter frigidicola]TXD97465.1 OmpA family protein [Psychrobacter frigidicola]
MTIKICSKVAALCAVLALSACRTTTQNPLITNAIIVDAPTIFISIDSDGDGVPDDIDECPGTPLNVVVDDRGCPHSLLFGENEFRMEARAYYAENSSEIKSEYYEQLDNAGKKMQDHLDAVMHIEGHISKREDNGANQTLSRYRVEGIKNYMTMKYNIDPDRINTFYYGSERPIATNDAENSWLNQRIYALISNVE